MAELPINLLATALGAECSLGGGLFRRLRGQADNGVFVGHAGGGTFVGGTGQGDQRESGKSGTQPKESEELDAIAAIDRTTIQKEALNQMSSAARLTESVRTFKTDRRDLEKKLEELKKKVREMTEHVKQTVSSELFGDFKEKRSHDGVDQP